MNSVAIVTRSFWPGSAAIGEALLLLAESLSRNNQVRVIAQAGKKFHLQLQAQQRGKRVNFSMLPSFTTSSSHLVLRILELIVFGLHVFILLCWHRPDKVYVTTNPPVLIPFLVRLYCEIFKKCYVYHLQDIHPEATQVATGKDNILLRLLQSLDSKTIIRASKIITLTQQMRNYVCERVGAAHTIDIVLLENPSVETPQSADIMRSKGMVFCGNAGRLQLIPLLLESIEQYIEQGGTLPFIFAGGGIHVPRIKELVNKYQQVSYLGVLPGDKAAELMRRYSYGLMPIEDKVMKYAFPSKSSSYIAAGCQVVAICGADTSVAQWVENNGFGCVTAPNVEEIVKLFVRLETLEVTELQVSSEFLQRLTPAYHAAELERLILEG